MAISPSISNYQRFLPSGLQLGDFKIIKTIDFSGLSIVYLAYEVNLERIVAIKEYFPFDQAVRNEDMSVRVILPNLIPLFEHGLKSFIAEAKLQAKFSHDSLLEIFRVWEDYGTAYIAMRYYQGNSLRTIRKSHPHKQNFPIQLIRLYLQPICEGIREIHSHEMLHRDISPDNILVDNNGRSVILGIDTSRKSKYRSSQQLTCTLKPGYAPIEQYCDDDAIPEGPWTDVYAIGAVIHFLITGIAPPQPANRILGSRLDQLDQASTKINDKCLIEAVRLSLAVYPEDRIKDIDELLSTLNWASKEKNLKKKQDAFNSSFQDANLAASFNGFTRGLHRTQATFDEAPLAVNSEISKSEYSDISTPEDFAPSKQIKQITRKNLTFNLGTKWNYYYLLGITALAPVFIAAYYVPKFFQEYSPTPPANEQKEKDHLAPEQSPSRTAENASSGNYPKAQDSHIKTMPQVKVNHHTNNNENPISIDTKLVATRKQDNHTQGNILNSQDRFFRSESPNHNANRGSDDNLVFRSNLSKPRANYCDSLYTKLSLNTIALTQEERDNLNKCR